MSREGNGTGPGFLQDEGGFSLVEALIAVIILVLGALAVASTVSTSAGHMQSGERDLRLWSAIRAKMDELAALGYAGVTAGSETVDGFAMSWSVQGTTPKKIILEVQAGGYWRLAEADTIVLYLAEPTP